MIKYEFMKGGWCHREKNEDISLYINITLKTRSSIWYHEGIGRWIKKIFHKFCWEGRETRDWHFFMNRTSTKRWRKHLSTQVEIYSTFFTVYLWRHHFSLPSQRIRGSLVDTFMIPYSRRSCCFYKWLFLLNFMFLFYHCVISFPSWASYSSFLSRKMYKNRLPFCHF